MIKRILKFTGGIVAMAGILTAGVIWPVTFGLICASFGIVILSILFLVSLWKITK